MQLKTATDGLSKCWKIDNKWEPFYMGGSFHLNSEADQYLTEFNGSILQVDIDNSSNSTSIFPQQLSIEIDEEFQDKVNYFIPHPINKNEIIYTTQHNNIVHYDILKKKKISEIHKISKMPIISLDMDPSGTLVAVSLSDKNLRVYDMEKKYCTHSLKYSSIIKTIKFLSGLNELKLFGCCEDGSIICYDLRESKIIHTYSNHFSLPTSISFTSNNYLMISVGRDKVLNCYELRDNVHVKTVPLMEELETVSFLQPDMSLPILSAFYKDNKYFEKKNVGVHHHLMVTGGSQGILKFFSVYLKGKDIDSFSLTPLFQVSLGEPAQKNQESLKKAISHLFFSEQRKELIAINEDFLISHYTLDQLVSLSESAYKLKLKNSEGDTNEIFFKNFKPNKLVIGHFGEILDIVNVNISSSVKPDGDEPSFKVAVVSNSPQIRTIDNFGNTDIYDGHTDIILASDVSPCGKYLATVSKDKTLRVWDMEASQFKGQKVCIAQGIGHTDSVSSVGFSKFNATYASRRAYIVTGGNDKILKKWSFPLHTLTSSPNTTNLTCSHSIRAHDKDINFIISSPDDKILASCSQDKLIKLWYINRDIKKKNSKKRQRLENDSDSNYSSNSDNEYESEDESIQVTAPVHNDLTLMATLIGHKRGVWKVVFPTDEKILYSCSYDRTIRMWSLSDFKTLRVFEGHTSSVMSVIVLTGMDIDRLRKDQGKKLEYDDEYYEENDDSTDVKEEEKQSSEPISQNHHQQIISSGSDGLLRLWTVRTGECEAVLEGHDDRVWGLTWLGSAHTKSKETGFPKSYYFLSAGSDSKILLWKESTIEEENEKLEEKEKVIQLEQKLRNFFSNKKYFEALQASLSLNMPNQSLRAIQLILEDDDDKWISLMKDRLIHDNIDTSNFSSLESYDNYRFQYDWAHRLDDILYQLSPELLVILLKFALKDWNNSSRTSYYSQILLSSLLSQKKVKYLLEREDMREIKESIDGVLAYTDRHFKRISKLSQACHYIDYILNVVSLDSSN